MEILTIKQRLNAAPRVPRIAWVGTWASDRWNNSMHNGVTWNWFDIGSGWVTDAAGILFVKFRSGGDIDAWVNMDGSTIFECHISGGRVWCGSFLCPAGARIEYGVGGGNKGNVEWVRYMRGL